VATLQLAANGYLATGINAMDLENRFGMICVGGRR
jgi:hypothetical protein